MVVVFWFSFLKLMYGYIVYSYVIDVIICFFFLDNEVYCVVFWKLECIIFFVIVVSCEQAFKWFVIVVFLGI